MKKVNEIKLDIENYFADNMKDIEPYSVVPSSELTFNNDSFLKLDWNESTLPPSEIVINSLIEFLKSKKVNYYPDVNSNKLKESLADYCGIKKTFIQIFNGSDCAMEYLCKVVLNPKDIVTIFQPTYDNFRLIAQCSGALINNIILDDPFIFNLRKIKNHIPDNSKIVYLVNPNNPSGYIVNLEDIEFIFKKINGFVLLDEAYFEYCGKTSIELLKSHNNLIIIRSFSKAFGLAGLRLGYSITNETITNYLSIVKNTKSVNELAQIAGLAALKDVTYMKEYVNKINLSKRFIANEFKDLNVEIRITPANYFLIKVDNPKEVVNKLRLNDIYVRDRSNMPNFSGYIRITIGTINEMKVLHDVLKKILSVS